MRNRIAAALFVMIALACASQQDIVELQPAIRDTGPDTFHIRLESNEMSPEDLRQALLFHTARKTIDSGNVWFVMETSDVDRSLDTTGVATSGPDTVSGRPGEEQQTSGVNISRSAVAEGFVRMYKVKPDRADAREASRVIEEVSEAIRR